MKMRRAAKMPERKYWHIIKKGPLYTRGHNREPPDLWLLPIVSFGAVRSPFVLPPGVMLGDTIQWTDRPSRTARAQSPRRAGAPLGSPSGCRATSQPLAVSNYHPGRRSCLRPYLRPSLFPLFDRAAGEFQTSCHTYRSGRASLHVKGPPRRGCVGLLLGRVKYWRQRGKSVPPRENATTAGHRTITGLTRGAY
jgi:hypothetical protein